MQEGSFFTKVPAGHSLIPNPSLEVHALLEYFESVVKNWLPHPRGGQLAAKFFSAEKKFETHSFGFAAAASPTQVSGFESLPGVYPTSLH
jgi:hypothetical protein